MRAFTNCFIDLNLMFSGGINQWLQHDFPGPSYKFYLLHFVLIRNGSDITEAEEALELDKASPETKQESNHLKTSNNFPIVFQRFLEDFHTVQVVFFFQAN